MSPETAREIADELAAGDSADLGLGLAERTLLYGFRRMASGGDQCPATRREFANSNFDPRPAYRRLKSRRIVKIS